MKRDFIETLLKDKGLSEEDLKNIVDSIMRENGNDITKEQAKAEVIKNDLKVKEALIDELNAKVKDENEIEKLKKEQFDLGKAEGSKEVDDFKKHQALQNSIKGAKDFDLVASKLNKEKLQYEKDEKNNYVVKGIDEQIQSIKTAYPYLFNSDNSSQKNIDINLGDEHSSSSESNGLNMLKEAMGIKTNK